MEPTSVQYARTADGLSIAFQTIGEGGTPLVGVYPVQQGQLRWAMPEIRRHDQRLARNRMLVWYDGRGFGLSERDVTEFSIDGQVLDLASVADRLGLEAFAIWAFADGGPAAIAYAARYPDRVSHLILWCCVTRGADLAAPGLRGLGRLLNENWPLYTETVAHAMMGWSAGEAVRRWAELMREAATPESLRRYLEALRGFDATPLLGQVTSPTLVLHRRQVVVPSVDVARNLASRMPNAHLVLLEGSSAFSALGDMEAVAKAIDEFLGEDQPARAAAMPASAPSGLVTILFTDIEGSTAMTQRLGDAKAREVLREHERITRDCFRAHGGSEVKTMGDGFMASFGSAVKALECAIAVQHAFDEHNAGVGRDVPPERLYVRIGLNAGEPIAEDDPDGRGDLHGTAVITAARIAALAQGGEILVSDVVRQLVAGKRFLFNDRGDHALKGFEYPVRVYEVRWQGDA